MRKEILNKTLTLTLVVLLGIVGGALLKTLITTIEAVIPTPTVLYYSSIEPPTFGPTYWSEWETEWSNPADDSYCDNNSAIIKVNTGDNPDYITTVGINTTGYSNLVLSFWYKIPKKLESGDWVKVQWSKDNFFHSQDIVTYSNIQVNNWTYASFSLPTAAENTTSLKIRFIANLNVSGSDKDEFRLDCVKLTGIPTPTCTDNDGDGYGQAGSSGCTYAGIDCDDTNASINPGATETIGDGIDQNCDSQELCYIDSDNDGYRTNSTVQSNDLDCTDEGEATPSTPNGDCDDSNASIKPGATEICNNVDDDCDGVIDEGVLTTYYFDSDGDGYGDNANSIQACSPPEGYVSNGSDCDDTNNSIYPGATEVCNGKDDDCDGTIDEGCECTNGDQRQCGETDVGECSYGTQTCTDGTWGACVGAILPSEEVCDGLDNDCDGQTDEGVTIKYYQDSDGDTYGNPNNSTAACSLPEGYVTDNTDCNDGNGDINPGATDICGNDIDEDCDGSDAICQNSSIEGHKYNDLDKDGEYDQTDIAVGGWDIFIDLDKDGEFDDGENGEPKTTTDGSGHFIFSNIALGTYSVCEEAKIGWTNSPNSPTCKEVTVTNEPITVNFFNYQVEQPVTNYTCNQNTWQCVEDPEGQYADLATCNANCQAPTTTPTTTPSSPGGSVPPEIPTGGQVLGAATTTAPATEETTPSQGEVAGVSTTCEPYLLKYIKYGANNDPEEVKKLEKFLNDYLGLNLPVDGFYSLEDVAAVKKFQLACQNEVLKPWVDIGLLGSINEPTGYVYRTTQRWINMIMCPSLNLAMPDLSDELAKYQLATGEGEGEVLGETTTTPSGSEELTATEEPTETTTNETETEVEATNPPPPNNNSLVGLWILIGVIIVGGIIFVVMRKKK